MTNRSLFGGYLSALYPSQIVIDVTEFCNLSCIHCLYASEIKPKGKTRLNFSQALHTKLVKDIRENGLGICQFVRYTGDGEPLLHPHIIDFLTEMSGIGIQTSLTTNGLLLTPDRCAALLNSGVAAIDISVDAYHPETYAKIRRGGQLADLIEGVRCLLKLRGETKSAVKIMTSFIHQADNAGEDELFKKFWLNEGIDLAFVRNLHSCAGHVEDAAKELWAKAPKLRKPCLYPWERLMLRTAGQIEFCPNEWKHESIVGDLNMDTIESVWQGEAMHALRQAHLDDNFTCHNLCGACPDWSATFWPDEGRTYATAMNEFKKSN